MSTETTYDPFSAKGVLIIPDIVKDSSSTWEGFTFEPNPKSGHLNIAKITESHLGPLRSDVLRLSLDDVHLLELNPQSPTLNPLPENYTQDNGGLSVTEQNNEAVWTLPELHTVQDGGRIISWDDFNEGKAKQPNQYNLLSESDNLLYDAIVRIDSHKTHEKPLQYAKIDIFQIALTNLALGRESSFFAWKQDVRSFEPTVSPYVILGISDVSLVELLRNFIEHGKTYRQLRLLSKFGSEGIHIQAAANSAMGTCLDAIQEYFASRAHQCSSILHQHVRLVRSLEVVKVLEAVHISLASHKGKRELLQHVALSLDTVVQNHMPYRNLLMEISRRIFDPVLRDLHDELFITPNLQIDDNKLDLALVLPSNLASIVNEVRHYVSLLFNETTTTILDLHTKGQPQIRMLGNWSEIIELNQYIDCKEQQSIDAMQSIGSDTIGKDMGIENTIEPLRNRESRHEHAFAVDFNLSTPTTLGLMIESSQKDTLKREIVMALEGQMSIDDIDLTLSQALEFSVSLVLSAQHRLMSYHVLSIIFKDQNITSILNILHGYLLLADGVFSTRLSDALFDPNQGSGEQNRVSGGKVGLRLQNRETWPPATSELRLALLNILSDCLLQSGDRLLQDDLSFAIRDLADEELDRIRDISSIYATDFLRLTYKPSNAFIESIVDTSTLDKYDQIFKFLLLVLRVKAVSSSLLSAEISRSRVGIPRSLNHRLYYELHYFMSTFFEYCHSIAIAIPWQDFKKLMFRVLHSISQQDYRGTLKLIGSVEQLCQRHAYCVSRMIEALFLEPKHVKIRASLENIFQTALKFSAASNKDKNMTRQVSEKWYGEFSTARSLFLENLVKATRRNTNADSSMFQYLMLKFNIS